MNSDDHLLGRALPKPTTPALPKPGPAPRASFLPPLKLPAQREADRLEAERIAALPPVPLKGRSAPPLRLPPRDPAPAPALSLVTEKLPQRLQARLHAVGAERLLRYSPGGEFVVGHRHEDLRALAIAEYGRLGVQSLTDLTEDQALYLIQSLEKLPRLVPYAEPGHPYTVGPAAALRLPPKAVVPPAIRTRVLDDDSELVMSPPERAGEVVSRAGVEISPALGRAATDEEILRFMADAAERKKAAAATNPPGVWKPGPVRRPEPTAVTPLPAGPPAGAFGKAWFLPPRR
jgi:hypothetical protein